MRGNLFMPYIVVDAGHVGCKLGKINIMNIKERTPLQSTMHEDIIITIENYENTEI
jgi:hypothetical protein